MGQVKSSALLIGAVLLVAMGSGAARAQIPPSTEPGAVIKRFEEKDRARRGLEEVVTVPKMDETATGVSDQKIFDLKTVVLDNSKVYTADDFAGVYNKYIGQKVSLADLNTIARGMTRKYREDGFIFSRVIVPPQKINNGVVHFQAVEGRIANVKVVGTFKDENGLVRALADKIRAAGPANAKDIERYLLLIDDLPGLSARSFIQPSQTPGGGDLVISVEEDDFEGSFSFDNRGSRYLGPFRGELVGAFNSWYGTHNRTTLRALTVTQSREIRYGEVLHEEQIGTNGQRFNGRLAVTDSAPGGNVSALGIDGSSVLLDLRTLYPLMRGRRMNFNLLGGFTGLNSETDLLGIEISSDHVRYLHVGWHLDFTDALAGVNQFEFQLAKGINALGSSDEGAGRSRANGKQTFLRENLTVTRIQNLVGSDLALFLSATGQLSSDPLLASEEFTVGGAAFGRAYDGGEIAGDKGYAGVAELRYNGPLADNAYIQSYQAYTFIDAGRVFNLLPAAGETANASIASAGLGVRFNMVNEISGYVELDSPLTRIVRSENNNESRLFFSLLKRF